MYKYFLWKGRPKKLTHYFSNTFIIALIHEMFHFIICVLLKVKIKSLEILPFGVSLHIEDVDKISAELGYAPKSNFEEKLKETIEWYKEKLEV